MGAIGALDEAPRRFRDEGACPFECCSYREWTVLADTPLLRSPRDDAEAVGTALKGTRVQGLTGIVEVTSPGTIEVLRTYTSETSGKTYAPGDLLAVYTERGEGLFRVWYRGEMYDEEAFFMRHDLGGWARCVEDGACWGARRAFPRSVWWVNVKTQAGITGWSRRPENFGDKDACG